MTTETVRISPSDAAAGAAGRKAGGPSSRQRDGTFETAIVESLRSFGAASHSPEPEQEAAPIDAAEAGPADNPGDAILPAPLEMLSEGLADLAAFAGWNGRAPRVSAASAGGDVGSEGGGLAKISGSAGRAAPAIDLAGLARTLAGLELAPGGPGDEAGGVTSADLSATGAAPEGGKTALFEKLFQARQQPIPAGSAPAAAGALSPGLNATRFAGEQGGPVPASVRRRETHFGPALADRDLGNVSAAADQRQTTPERVVATDPIGKSRGHKRSVPPELSPAVSSSEIRSKTTNEPVPAQDRDAAVTVTGVSGQIVQAVGQLDREGGGAGEPLMTEAPQQAPQAPRVARSPVRVLTLTLAPAELGQVTITLKGNSENVQIHVEVERGDTARQLEEERGDLIGRLAGVGYKVDDIAITRQTHETSSDAARDRSGLPAGDTRSGQREASGQGTDRHPSRATSNAGEAMVAASDQAGAPPIPSGRPAMFTSRVV